MKWVSGPPEIKRTSPGRYDAMVQELRDHPGQWALVAEGAKSGAASTMLKSRGNDIQTVTRSRFIRKGIRVYDVYARATPK